MGLTSYETIAVVGTRKVRGVIIGAIGMLLMREHQHGVLRSCVGAPNLHRILCTAPLEAKGDRVWRMDACCQVTAGFEQLWVTTVSEQQGRQLNERNKDFGGDELEHTPMRYGRKELFPPNAQ